MAAWAKQFNIAPPPPPKPAAPTTFLGAPGSVPLPKAGPYPGYMSVPDMMAAAKKMAEETFGPALQEAYRQQRMLHDNNMAQLQAIQAAYQAIGIDKASPLGVAAYNKAMAEAQASESDFAGKIVDLVSQQNQAAQGIFGDMQKQQAGMASSYQSAHQLRYHYGAGGEITAIDPATGQLFVIRKGTEAGTGQQTKLTIRQQANGQLVAIDPYTGKVVSTIGNPRVTTAKAPTPVTLANGQKGIYDPTTGTITLAGGFNPARPGTGSGGRYTPPSPAMIRRGWQTITDSYYHPIGRNRRYTIAELDAKIRQTNAARLKAWQNADPAKRGPQPTPLTRGDIARMTPAQKRLMGIQGTERPAQDVYMDLVHAGIPARRAWQMVRKVYPGFGEGYFPKDNAAQMAATTGFPANASSEFATVDAEGAPDAQGVRHHAAYDWMLGANAGVPSLVTGKVIEANPSRGNSGQVYGGTVKILTPDGRVLVYRHVSPNVKVGAQVRAGQRVATVVRWADNPGSSHAHTELWKTQAGGYRYDNMLDPTSIFGGGQSFASGGGEVRDPNAARQYAFSTATTKYGWGTKEIAALNQLWTKESDWKYQARNSSSGALGIPQALGHELPAGYAEDPIVQINWGLSYIQSRYRTPSRAWAFWRATVNKNANLAPADLRRVARTWIANGWAGY